MKFEDFKYPFVFDSQVGLSPWNHERSLTTQITKFETMDSYTRVFYIDHDRSGVPFEDYIANSDYEPHILALMERQLGEWKLTRARYQSEALF